MIIPIEELKTWFYIYSMGIPRILAMFAFIPFLHKKMLGGTIVRNGLAMVLILFIHPLLAQYGLKQEISIYHTIFIVLKEALIGAFIGFVITIPFWALESAGFFIDNQRGASMASMMNPFSGAETSPLGIMFVQVFIAIFVISGLFLLLLSSLFLSYQTWQVFSYFPKFNAQGVLFFLNQFDLIISLSMWLCAPVIISMFIAEFAVALISRSAPQLNVFILAMPIKSAVAFAVLSIYVVTIFSLAKKHNENIPEIFMMLGSIWK